MLNFLLVALEVGSAAMRYGVGVFTLRQFGPNFPIGTITVNWLGSFLIGLFIIMIARRFEVPQPHNFSLLRVLWAALQHFLRLFAGCTEFGGKRCAWHGVILCYGKRYWRNYSVFF